MCIIRQACLLSAQFSSLTPEILLFLPFCPGGLYNGILLKFSVEKCVSFIFTHNLLIEIAAASLSKGGKYVAMFSVLTGGILSHLPDKLVSALHVVPMQVQHFTFSLSSFLKKNKQLLLLFNS